jgi:predicted  nucleic acid-binding Zn-ribbon protein
MKPILPLLLLAGLTACSSLYYSTMEKLGYQKRDLLVDRVQEAKESQADAKQQIQTTFEAFQGLTGFQGGELESRYKQLKGLHDQSTARAADVTKRIASIEEVGGDMFSEWEQEIEQIENRDLRAQSKKMKADTEQRYAGLIAAMKAAEQRMQPVLTAFHDQVLFLKHNLNAAAISSLQGEVTKMQSDVAGLIAEMQKAIDAADRFVQSLPPSE